MAEDRPARLVRLEPLSGDKCLMIVDGQEFPVLIDGPWVGLPLTEQQTLTIKFEVEVVEVARDAPPPR